MPKRDVRVADQLLEQQYVEHLQKRERAVVPGNAGQQRHVLAPTALAHDEVRVFREQPVRVVEHHTSAPDRVGTVRGAKALRRGQ